MALPEPDTPDRNLENADNGRPWLRCYRCWSQSLEIQIHYDAIRRVDPETGVPAEGIDEVQELSLIHI